MKHRSLLGSFPPGSEVLIRLALVSLRSKFLAPNYEFSANFNPKTGNHDVFVLAEHYFPPYWLEVLQEDTK